MRFFTILLLFIFTVSFSQEKIKHVVVSGESVYSIAKKYDLKESDIFDLNPKAKGALLQLKSVLWIPNKNFKSKENQKIKEKKKRKEENNVTLVHEVLAKETLYGISKKYKTTVDKIKEANPSLEKEGLKNGSRITILVSKEVFETESNVYVNAPVITPKQEESTENNAQNYNETIVHNVLAKETKYGISKRYGISIAELEKLNPKIVNGLSIGDELLIRKGKNTEAVVSTSTQNNENDTASVKENTTVEAPSMSANAASKAEFLISKASENIGVRYRGGGTNRNGFDCSGLMFATFSEINMTLPRSSRDMAASAGIKVDRNQAQKGDLIFFSTMGGGISHVGMITEVLDDEIKFIHSSTSAGVIISSIKESYYAKRFVQINRVLTD